MLRGFYIASNAIINEKKNIDTISNNIANSQTAGFKSDMNVSNTFEKELLLLCGGRINKTGTIEYKYAEESKTNLKQGTFEFTERPLDIAIEGPVYFNIEAQNGDKLLTRNGQFDIDDEGFLELAGAGRVLGENGTIQIGTSDFSVDTNGHVFIDGIYKDTLELTYIEENESVIKVGDNTFTRTDDGNGEIPVDVSFSVIQGAYERSNVDVAVEMTRSIASQRAFESLAQALTMIDTINQKAATEIAKV